MEEANIDVRYYFLRDLCKCEMIELKHCRSEDQIADIQGPKGRVIQEAQEITWCLHSSSFKLNASRHQFKGGTVKMLAIFGVFQLKSQPMIFQLELFYFQELVE